MIRAVLGWVCSACGHHNPPQHTACRKCRTPEADMSKPDPLTIGEILDLPALVPVWPTVGRALGISEATIYRLAARGELPFEAIRIGRKQMVRTVDLHEFLRLKRQSDAA